MQKYLIGTLFDEQEQDKKTNLSNIKAKDPFGNSRWKGAFTGGFEAGYKNTCGSKEGWQPSQFVSSIYKKHETVERTIFDYMDKEDLGKQSISQNIVLNNNFQSSKDSAYNISLQESIGQKILNRLKKSQARLKAPENQEDLNKLLMLYAKEQEVIVHPTQYNLKDLVSPLSVNASNFDIQEDDFIEAYEDLYRKVIRDHAKQESEEQIKKRREENKIYFDFTKPLDDEPEYLKQIHEIQNLQKPKKRKKNLINQDSLQTVFKNSGGFKEFKKILDVDKAPEDYDPYYRIRNLTTENSFMVKNIESSFQQKQKHLSLSISKRSQLLGQQKLSNKFVSSQNNLNNKFISNQSKVQEIAKFFEDEKKNHRYNQFVLELEGKKISSQLQYTSYEQAEKEKAQFEKLYRLQTEKKKSLPDKVQESLRSHKTSTEIEMKRSIDSWRPQKLLCKRFNVLTPYTIQPKKKDQFMNQFV